jgi:hypothetical protein
LVQERMVITDTVKSSNAFVDWDCT